MLLPLLLLTSNILGANLDEVMQDNIREELTQLLGLDILHVPKLARAYKDQYAEYIRTIRFFENKLKTSTVALLPSGSVVAWGDAVTLFL